MERILGVITFKAPVYKEIAEDQNATTTAAIIVVAMAIFGGVLAALALSLASAGLPAGVSAGSPIRVAISTVINTIIGWLIGSAVFAFVANALGGRTNTGEMLRVFGYTQIFQVLNIIPCLGAIAALVLSVIGAIIGIREAGEFSTGKAVVTGIIGIVILFIVGTVVGLILAPFLG